MALTPPYLYKSIKSTFNVRKLVIGNEKPLHIVFIILILSGTHLINLYILGKIALISLYTYF